MRFHAWMVTHILNAQIIYFQREDGTMHREITEAVLGFNAAMLNTHGGRSWWERSRTIWRPEFTEHMEQRMGDSPAVDTVWPWFLLDSTDENAAR